MIVYAISPLGFTGLSYYDFSLNERLSLNIEHLTLFTSRKVVNRKIASYNTVHIFNYYSYKTKISKFISYFISLFKIMRIVNKNRPDIIHLQLLQVPIVDFLFINVIKRNVIKIVYTPHDLFPIGKSSRFILKIYNSVDAIIVHNAGNIQELKQNGVEEYKLHLIPHGNYNDHIDEAITQRDARRKLNISIDKKILLFIGSIRQGKGLHILVDAYDNGLGDNVELLIVGRVQNSFVDVNLLERINNSNIRFENIFIADELLEIYYKAADLIIIPYEKISESGVLKYAFTCGIPTIISDLKEFMEYLVDQYNCIKFESGNSNDLRNKILFSLENSNLLSKIAINAKNYSDKYWSWDEISKKTIKLYENLISSKLSDIEFDDLQN